MDIKVKQGNKNDSKCCLLKNIKIFISKIDIIKTNKNYKIKYLNDSEMS